ncbi:hypothetical protein M3590_24735, partial [Priestia koreensis]
LRAAEPAPRAPPSPFQDRYRSATARRPRPEAAGYREWAASDDHLTDRSPVAAVLINVHVLR